MTHAHNSTTTTGATRILLVEDEPSAREASQRYLSRCGYEVVAAADAEQALASASEAEPDVAVCDWRLGGTHDGVHIARELQRRYGARIIFVTAYPLDELQQAATDVQVHGFLRKPISLEQLAQTIAAVTA